MGTVRDASMELRAKNKYRVETLERKTGVGRIAALFNAIDKIKSLFASLPSSIGIPGPRPGVVTNKLHRPDFGHHTHTHKDTHPHSHYEPLSRSLDSEDLAKRRPEDQSVGDCQGVGGFYGVHGFAGAAKRLPRGPCRGLGGVLEVFGAVPPSTEAHPIIPRHAGTIWRPGPRVSAWHISCALSFCCWEREVVIRWPQVGYLGEGARPGFSRLVVILFVIYFINVPT
ncbi:hypothetical protein B0J13DRAFT_14467 [Dactylonectria estremocensis]|uniref:Uncharacterized protein n=1 Tax=Dactylonectria estremocensis TaxID=1079267 RepID=A0A9P9JDL5_9HYPO|nr:hypothetical protein B0J13DRAFT_14467 [Dactylonectria estremocensis]